MTEEKKSSMFFRYDNQAKLLSVSLLDSALVSPYGVSKTQGERDKTRAEDYRRATE